ncbi:hypothetical protein LguiB_000662 [Lonicera macranthoides]
MSEKRQKIIDWRPVGPDMLPKLEPHPNGIVEFYSKSTSKPISSPEMRKHLLDKGWTVEYRPDQRGPATFLRFRYSPPNRSKTYYSLQSLRGALAEAKPGEHSMETLSPISQVDEISLAPASFSSLLSSAFVGALAESKPGEHSMETLSPISQVDQVSLAPASFSSLLSSALIEQPRMYEYLRESPMEPIILAPACFSSLLSSALIEQPRMYEYLRESPMEPLNSTPLQRRLAAAPCNLFLHEDEDLRESLMKKLSPIPQDGQKSLAIVSSSTLKESTKPSPCKSADIEPEYCPQAIVEYVKYFNLGSPQARDRLLKVKVKKHLRSVGWEIFYIEKAPKREELRYRSPSGKRYISLITACKGYLNEQGKFDQVAYPSNVNEEAEEPTNHSSHLALTRSTDGLDSDYLNCVNERAPRVETPPPSRQNLRNILARLIDNNEVSAGAEVHYRGRDGRPMAEGYITRDGIECHCCQKVFNLSNFELHAGSTNHRPAANIFLKDGRSLKDCQLLLKRDVNNNRPHEVVGNRKYTLNGYRCSICHNGGALVLCYQCPSSFHTSCLGLEEVPNGDWFCQWCEDKPTNEAEYCPQAIVDYFLSSNMLTRIEDNNKKLRDLRSKVKKHLCSIGWSFFYTSEGTKRELQYKSPSGGVYASLIAACEGCIYEDGSQLEQLTTLSD